MASLSAVGATGTQGQQAPGASEQLRGLNTKQFIDLMIKELQNQDPLNPMENSQMLEQISQIRAIESQQSLTNTLNAVMLGQSISSASALIGRDIQALNDEGDKVSGKVERVTMEGGEAKLIIGKEKIRLANVKEIFAA